MSVCHVYTDVHGWQKRALDFLELMLVSCLTWILGPKLVPSEEMGRIHFYCWRRMLNISVTNKNSEVRLQVQSKSYTVCSTYSRATLWTASCIKAGLICSLIRKAYERFCILLKMSYGKTKSDDSSIEKKHVLSVQVKECDEDGSILFLHLLMDRQYRSVIRWMEREHFK